MRGFLIVLVWFLLSCGAVKPRTAPEPSAVEEGARAYLIDGDRGAARKRLEAAVFTEPEQPGARFLLGDSADLYGEPAIALSHYLRTLSVVHSEGGDAHAAVAAAMGVVTIRERVEGFDALFERFYHTIRGTKGKLPNEAWYQLQNLRFGLLRRSAGGAKSNAALREIGCPLTWQTIGPVGPWVWSEFDAENEVLEQSRTWPATVDLGPGRGATGIRTVKGDTCIAELFNPELPLAGVTWARTVLLRDQPGPVEMRLMTSAAVSLRVNGKEVFKKDTREAFLSPVSWFSTDLPRGAVEIMIKMATQSLPSFSLVVTGVDGKPAYREVAPNAATRFKRPKEAIDRRKADMEAEAKAKGWDVKPKIELSTLVDAFARLRIALFWDDIELARKLADAIEKQWGEMGPVLVQAMAEAEGADPALPGDVAYERARRLYSAALEREPRLWQSRIALADRELDEDRIQNAIGLLEKGRALSPNEPQILRRLGQTFLSHGWFAEAEDAIGKIEVLMPTSCNTLAWRLALAKQRSQFDAMLDLAAKISKCDAFSKTLQEELLRSQQWARALTEAGRLAAQSPRNVATVMDLNAVARAAGDQDTVVRSSEKVLALAPINPTVTVGLADAKASTGDDAGARAVLEKGLSYSLGQKPILLDALAGLDGEMLLKAYRIDGLETVKRYQRVMPEYESSAVYVLDRAVYRVGADGSVLMVVHTIVHLKTDEAVERHGELNLPPSASLLTARTIKNDGRILEPEEMVNKPSFSMPDLSPGDFVESEYVLYFLPNQIFPGGFDTERFYFKDFETAFHRSEIIVIVPEDMPIRTDPRGPCPPVKEEATGDLRILTWKAVDAEPHPEEPLSPEATEYLPSIRVTAEATWESLMNRVQDALAEKDRASRVIDRAVVAATRGIRPDQHERRRRAIYYWVLDNIEPEGDMFEQASHIIASKRGDRSRAFVAMLKAAGYNARLALVHPSGADETADALPSLKLYSELVVQVAKDGMIHLGSEHASYGYLPPRLRSRPVVFIDTAARTEIGPGAVSHDEQHVQMLLTIRRDGSATGRVRERLRGHAAVQWRQGLESNDPVELRRMFQGAYLATAIPGAILKDLEIEEKENRNVPLVLSYEVEIPAFAKKTGETRRVEVPFKTSLRKRSGGLPMRQTPLVMTLHADKSVDLMLEIPEGMSAVLWDDFNEAEASTWGEIRREKMVQGNRVRLGYRTVLDVDRVPPEKYVAFLLFARKVDRISNLDFVLTEGETDISAPGTKGRLLDNKSSKYD